MSEADQLRKQILALGKTCAKLQKAAAKKPIKTRGHIPEGVYTNADGHQLRVTWEAYDDQSYAEMLKKAVTR